VSIRRTVRSFAFQSIAVAMAGIMIGLSIGTHASRTADAAFITLPAGHWCGVQWHGDPAADLGSGDHFAVRIGNAFCDVV
jgi:hypothetical protein